MGDSLQDSRAGGLSASPQLNQIISGFRTTDLVLLVSGPGAGNTDVAMSMLANAAGKNQLPMGYLNLETSSDQIVQRLVEIESGIVNTGSLPAAEFSQFTDAAGRVYNWPIFFADVSNAALPNLLSHVRIMKARHDIKLLFVDSLNRIDPGSHERPQNQQAVHLASSLKDLCRELELPIIALVEARKNEAHTMPSFDDLGEFVSVKEFADHAIFVGNRKEVPASNGVSPLWHLHYQERIAFD